MAYNKEWYNNNKKEILANRVVYNKNRKRRYQWLVWKIKSENGCSRCEEKDPRCLEFHHPNDDKEGSISELIRNGVSWEKILAEIKKCELICSNCHAKIHIPLREEPIEEPIPYKINNKL